MNPSKLPGIALCLVIALPSWFLGKTFPIIGGPIISILLGMVAGQFLKDRTKVKSGISFTSKYILQTAVVFLGFGLNLSVILATGWQSLPIIICTIATSLIIAYGLQKAMNIDVNKAPLSASVHPSAAGPPLQRQRQSSRQRMMKWPKPFRRFSSLTSLPRFCFLSLERRSIWIP